MHVVPLWSVPEDIGTVEVSYYFILVTCAVMVCRRRSMFDEANLLTCVWTHHCATATRQAWMCCGRAHP